jgi:hypothetical protein
MDAKEVAVFERLRPVDGALEDAAREEDDIVRRVYLLRSSMPRSLSTV